MTIRSTLSPGTQLADEQCRLSTCIRRRMKPNNASNDDSNDNDDDDDDVSYRSRRVPLAPGRLITSGSSRMRR